MLNKIFAVALICAFSLSLAQGGGTYLSGHMTWLTGRLGSQITIANNTPQTISIIVNGVTDTFTGTLFTGAPGTVVPAGTEIAFIERGSQPFQGTYSGNRNGAVYDPLDGTGIAYARNLTVTQFGGISYNVATVIGTPGGELVFNLPPCTNGSYTFSNGITATFTAAVNDYTLVIPTTGTNYSNVVFPIGSEPFNSVLFSAYGNGTLTFQGAGANRTISVAGNFTGTSTIFTNASLAITTAP